MHGYYERAQRGKAHIAKLFWANGIFDLRPSRSSPNQLRKVQKKHFLLWHQDLRRKSDEYPKKDSRWEKFAIQIIFLEPLKLTKVDNDLHRREEGYVGAPRPPVERFEVHSVRQSPYKRPDNDQKWA